MVTSGLRTVRRHQTAWGTLNTITLNTGEYVRKIPLGNYPEWQTEGRYSFRHRKLGRSHHDRERTGL